MRLIRRFGIEIALVITIAVAFEFGWQRNPMRHAATPAATVEAIAAGRGGVTALRTPTLGHALPQTTAVSVDTITIDGKSHVVAGSASVSIPVGAHQSVDIAGWAVDAVARAPAAAVFATIGTAPPVLLTYGGKRDDVARALGNAAFTNVAFEGTFQGAELKRGTDPIVIDVVPVSGTGYYRVKTPVSLTVR